MTVYFTASITGKKYFLTQYQRVVDILRQKGCSVISDHILDTSVESIKSETKDQRLAFQRRQEVWINSCDFVVAETSFPSTSVGYEISLALHRNKPVLLLYKEGNPPSLLAQHMDEKLVCERYKNGDMEDVIEDFMNYVKGSMDTRFTFFISAAMSAYLDKASLNRRVPKAVYVRRLIREDMERSGS